MNAKTVYSYHPQTGESLGATSAHASPLEPGVWLLPAHTTETPPPAAAEHHVAVWEGGRWALVEDWRGTEGYLDGEPARIAEIGPLPQNWSSTPPEPSLAQRKSAKIAEIRAEALHTGQRGATLLVAPDVAFHMALTPEDVALLQQASIVAKIEWDLLGLPPGDERRTAEIKEKWFEDGVETTRLHTEVPEAIHDATLALAALQAAEIYRRQEMLIQQVNDAQSPEEVQTIRWS